MVKESVDTALGLVQRLPDLLRSANSESLVEFTKPTRVEPIVLMDDKVVNISFIGDVLQSLNSQFAAYYLQAVALSVNVGNVDVIRLLDRVNPNRSLSDSAVDGIRNIGLRGSMESEEAYAFKLPVPGESAGAAAFGIESAWKTDRQLDEEGDERQGLSDTGKSVEMAREVTNLSVGQLLEVEVESGGQKATFPVAVRLVTTSAPPEGIVHTLSVGQKNNSAKERFHAWRSGQLHFVRDLVLCQDLIDAHKDALLKDNSGIYTSSIKRRRKNRLSSILSGSPSVATASNLIVMADSTRKQVEREIGGRLKDFRTREKVFKETYAMIMVVIDPDWEQVTFYHRSIDQATELSASDLKSQKGGKGPDVGEILKAYQLGNGPNL